MEVRGEARSLWIRPVLVQLPLEATRAGKGIQNDGQHEQQS